MPDPRNLFLLLPLVAACASGESRPTLPVDTPSQENWQALEAEELDPTPLRQDWWTDFGDPGLDQAVASALDDNFDLMAAAARVQAVAAQARTVAGDRLPQVNASLDLARSRQNIIGLPFFGFPEVLPVTNNRFSLGLNLSWELDLWGRLEANELAAIASLEASEAEYAAARLSLAGQTAKSWFARKEASAQVALAAASVENAVAQLAYWQLRYRNGGAADPMHRASAALAAARSSLPAAEQQLRTRERQLAILLGRYPTRSENSAYGLLPCLPGPVPAGLPALLVQRRPDLARAEAEVRAARARRRGADASLYPTFALTALTGTSSNELGDLLDGDFQVWSLGAGLTAPLFHGGALRAQAESAEALALAAELRFSQQFLRALAEVETALDSESLIRTRKEELVQQLAALSSRDRTLEDRYQAGVADPSQVYAVRDELLHVRSSLLSVQLLLLTNRIDLYLALGGGFENPQQP